MNFKIFTFGCKVNQYESEYVRQLMMLEGYTYTESDENADVVIVNSCSVTAVSDSKCRKLLRKIKRINPDCILLLCGCMSQAFPRKYENFEICDIVIGNTTRSRIPKYISDFIIHREQIIDITEHDRRNEEFEPCCVSDFSERTRAFLKIEDGCDRFCSYCIIPYARGRIRSKSLDDLDNEVAHLANNGYTEIVLVGINLSKYGSDIDLCLCDAVECVAKNPKVKRIRLGSLEPELLDEETISRLSKCEKFCPQFHLSLQSGCTQTLKRMNRRYTAEEYRVIVERIRRYFSDSAITTDVMVGFPGETEDEFKQSLDFVVSVGFAKVHVFPYSRRSGTVADKMSDQLTKSQKEERAALMIKHTEEKRQVFLQSQIDKEVEVLFEQKNSDGMFEGYTKNYTQVAVNALMQDLSGQYLRVKITHVDNDRCVGVLSDN